MLWASVAVVVAFNGNVEPKELTAQLMRGKPLKLKSLCKSCKTHRYYAEAYRKICPEITASVRMLLKRPANRKFEVWITGHGMGGALASMCGYELEMARVFIPENKRVFVTFGQPRVGNAHWARKFAQMFPAAIRVTHGDDPFPHVPPCYVNPAAKGTPDEQTCYELKDRKKKLWAFHNPTQVWYPNVMPAFDDKSKGEFKVFLFPLPFPFLSFIYPSITPSCDGTQVCNGVNWGEDPACRHSPLGVSIDDQRSTSALLLSARLSFAFLRRCTAWLSLCRLLRCGCVVALRQSDRPAGRPARLRLGAGG